MVRRSEFLAVQPLQAIKSVSERLSVPFAIRTTGAFVPADAGLILGMPLHDAVQARSSVLVGLTGMMLAVFRRPMRR